ncbi:MAG: hypothetical protein IJ745_04595 [Bacteroidales bacterium]|nr:hypothetical protein [Bacteroidales bacterium]
MIYKQTLATPSYLCDRHDRLHPWAAVRLCQEVSEYHSNSTGIGYEELLKQNRAWVIARAYYIIYRRPVAFEKIMLSTWSRGTDGLFAFRDYLIESEAGEKLLAGTSYWPMIDFASRRAVRLKDFVAGYEFHDIDATGHPKLDRLTMPPMPEPDCTLTARHSMIDHTQHVNNSEYVKLMFDALDETEFDVDQPFSLELNFQHETQPGDTVSVSHIRDNGAAFVQISNSRGLSVAAKIEHV